MKDYRTSNHQCIKDSMTVIIISSQSYKNEIILTTKECQMSKTFGVLPTVRL
jgi:hypothetical protein